MDQFTSISVLFITLVALCTILQVSYSQDSSNTSLNIEFQIYPTGYIPGILLTQRIAPRFDLLFRVGANIIDHGDQGKQDHEEGTGFGFTPGLRYYLLDGKKKWFTDFRTDFWFNSMDWQNEEFIPGFGTSGTSNIAVFQPTMSIGYHYPLSDTWILAPTLSIGVEYNIHTKGAEIGEGLIALLGIQFGRNF